MHAYCKDTHLFIGSIQAWHNLKKYIYRSHQLKRWKTASSIPIKPPERNRLLFCLFFFIWFTIHIHICGHSFKRMTNDHCTCYRMNNTKFYDLTVSKWCRKGQTHVAALVHKYVQWDERKELRNYYNQCDSVNDALHAYLRLNISSSSFFAVRLKRVQYLTMCKVEWLSARFYIA